MEFRQRTLDNGLEVVAECNPLAYSTAVAFFVKTGDRDETDGNSGVSHFLEHMAFKGTPTRSADDVNRELDEMGSHSNAYTSEEQTVYYAAVLPEYWDRAVELLSDILRPSLREEDFHTEKQVVLEEIAKYDDQPPFGAHEKCMAAHFLDHPLARSVLGTAASVGALTPAQMRAYFEERYSPGNMALAAAGNIDFEELVSLASRCCGDWAPLPVSRQTDRARPHRGLEVFHHHIATQQYAVHISGGPAAEDNDRYAGRILATVLGDDSGSRLYWALVDNGRAEYAATSAYEFQSAGVLMTCLCCARGSGRQSANHRRDRTRAGASRRQPRGTRSSQKQTVLSSHSAERAAGQPALLRRRELDPAARISYGARDRQRLSGRDAQRRRRRAGDVSAHRQHDRRRRPAARVGRRPGPNVARNAPPRCSPTPPTCGRAT